MTRTIELRAEFAGENWDYRIDFADKIQISQRGDGIEHKYIFLAYEDFDKIAAELANFRKLNDSVKEAA